MVIVYDLETKEILHTEDDRMMPVLPVGETKEKVSILEKEGKGFLSVPYELGVEVFNYRLSFNENDEFIGLQPKAK